MKTLFLAINGVKSVMKFLIPQGTVVLSMAAQETPSAEVSLVFKIKPALAICTYNAHVKIYKMRIVCEVSLGIADAMWIMAGIAGCIFFPYVLVMILERLVV